MKVEKIQFYKSLFLAQAKEQGLRGHLYAYESQLNWQDNWDIEALDLPVVFDKSLTSKISGRLWGGSQNSAKETMSSMISVNKEFMRSAFRDLFAIEKDLGLRCDRFLFYCDEAISNVPKLNVLDHKHDRIMMCVYLAFNFPHDYTLLDYSTFTKMMTKLESRNIPTEIELERYHKSMKVVHNLMAKDEDWIKVLSEAIGPNYIPGSLLVMNEFARFVAEHN